MVLLSIRNKERDLDLYPDELGPLVGEFDDDIMLLMDDLEAGNIDADEWRDRFAAMLAGAIALAYFVGMGGTVITADQRAAIDAMLAEQLAYLNRFYEAVAQTFEAGGEFDPAWRSRASMYADAVTEPFWEARTWPWPLPAYPGDGTSQCLTHCRCDWVIQVIDEAAGDADAFWMLGPVEHCQTCLERARRWNPLQIRGWKLPLYDTISKDDARALEKLSARLAQMAEVVALKHLQGQHDQSRHGRRVGGEANSAQIAARQRSQKRREDQKQKPNTNSQTVSVRPEDVIKRVREKYAAFDENSVEYQRLDRAMDNIYESRREYHNNNTRDNLINLIGDSTYGEYGRDAAILTMEDLKWNNDGTITLYRGGALGGQSWSTNIEWAKRFSVYGFGGPGGANPNGVAKLWKHNFTIDQLIVAMPWEGEVLVSKDAAMLGEEIGY